MAGPKETLNFSFAYNKKILITATGGSAYVMKADIKAGKSVIHIINRVLLPITVPEDTTVTINIVHVNDVHTRIEAQNR